MIFDTGLYASALGASLLPSSQRQCSFICESVSPLNLQTNFHLLVCVRGREEEVLWYFDSSTFT